MMPARLVDTAMTLGDLLGAEAGTLAAIGISDLVSDSRDVGPGCAFFALAGRTIHGLKFAERAIEDGAAVVLFDPADTPAPPALDLAVPVANLRDRLGELARRFYGRVSTRPWVAGITGTNGKTTVAWLVAQALAELDGPAGYVGTLGYGRVAQLAAHRLTTPDCLSLHREIASMSARHVALEVSSHALDQDRLAGLDIAAAVFTNLSRDHLDEHGDFATYASIKAELFRRAEIEHAVLNLDDPFAYRLMALIGDRCPVIGVSLEGREEADLLVKLRSRGADGCELDIRGRRGRATLRSALIGAFNGENLAVALGTLLARGVAIADAADALGQARPAPGRMEVFGARADHAGVIVDYAHTPDALSRALAVTRELCDEDVWCVFGCGGNRDRGKRALMGAAAAAADRIVLTSDNPRNEDPLAIIEDIRAGCAGHAHVAVEPDRRAAIGLALSSAKPGDLVLVAGKGHERTQVAGSRSIELDDRAVVSELLEALS